jgi:hypothetical protein
MTEYYSAQPYTEEERERDDALKRMSYGRWSLRRLLRPSRKAALQAGNTKKAKKHRPFKAQPWWLKD